MAKQQKQTTLAVHGPPTGGVNFEQPLRLTEPLFGVTKLPDGKYVAVRYEAGAPVALTPKRGGVDVGEKQHFAVSRALEAFRRACLGRHA